MNETFAERFRRVREAAAVSQRALGRQIGLSGSAISQWETGATLPEHIKASALERAAAILGCGSRYLLTGRDAPADEAGRPPHLDHISAWAGVEHHEHDEFVFLYLLENLLNERRGERQSGETERNLPFRPAFLAAKGWSTHTHYSMRVAGDSMEPTIQASAPVIVDVTSVAIESGRIYVLLIDGKPVVRRLDRLPSGRIRLRCDNPGAQYAPVEVAEGEIEILGRCVWTPITL